MRCSFLAILFLLAGFSASANHLKGGFFTYEYLGKGIIDTSRARYSVTLTMYMHCKLTPSQQDATVPFTFFDAGSNSMVANEVVPLFTAYELWRGNDECITNEDTGCIYTIRIYKLSSIELPINSSGYIVSFQRCCRIANIMNLGAPSNSYGTTYSLSMPGTGLGPNAYMNSSPKFLINDTAVVCAGNYFQLPFEAFDPDTTDQLQFSLCEAWIGGNTGMGGQNPSAASPPYGPVPYANGFSGASPLGSGVTINPNTGLISGTAPPGIGEYVITVCVTELRDGIAIATTRKELHVAVGNCNSADASLPEAYTKCQGFTYTFVNQVPHNAAIKTYHWSFGDGNTSTSQTPTHTYADTGTYVLTLVINRNDACNDSASSLVRVYPGFQPGFRSMGDCVANPTNFIDTSRSVYGVINKWSWDFGVSSASDDTSVLKNPSYTYMQTGQKTARLIVSDSKGCRDTVLRTIDIVSSPPLDVAFSDTLICKGDTLRLQAIGFGNFTWSPTANMSNPNVADPVVNPPVTTRYEVELNQNGCISFDTVRVRVVDFVTLEAFQDTVICLTDSATLGANTNGLRFLWSPSVGMNDATRLRPKVKPGGTTDYQITSIIGNCSTTDVMRVTTVPYPQANAGRDTVICFGAPAQLQASMTASKFSWSPAGSLTNLNTLTPIARPKNTTAYVLTVTDDKGCPKPVSDTIVVTVLPRIPAFAGNDTAVVAGQPLQLHAFGGTGYEWVPPISLSNAFVADPMGLYDGSFDSVRYKILVYNDAECVDSAFKTVRIFRTDPRVFVPTAFTPNGDGKNDVVRPIAAGIERIEYFQVYNRWGQLVFSTTVNGRGWDGRINGQLQGTGVFVWVVKAVDYKGITFFAKGTVTLIR